MTEGRAIGMGSARGGMDSWRAADYSWLAACFVPAVLATWGVHEGAHWLMGTTLGYDMWITFNNAGPVRGAYDTTVHRALVGMAGPAATWLQAIAALLLIRRLRALWTYSFLFLALWMRFLAFCISYISNPNDEASVSLLLGLPMWVLPAVSVALLATLTYMGRRSLMVGWKGNVLSYVMASLVSAVVVFSDRLLFFG